MLVSLTKKVSRQQLYIYGEFSREELDYRKRCGWRVEWQEDSKTQRNKNGIPVEGVAQ